MLFKCIGIFKYYMNLSYQNKIITMPISIATLLDEQKHKYIHEQQQLAKLKQRQLDDDESNNIKLRSNSSVEQDNQNNEEQIVMNLVNITIYTFHL